MIKRHEVSDQITLSPAMSVEEVAAALNISVWAARNWLESHPQVPKMRVGREYRINRSAFLNVVGEILAPLQG